MESDGSGLYAGAVASSITSGFLLLMSIHLSSNWELIKSRRYQIIAAILISAITCYGFTIGSWIAISGITLLYFIPQGIQSISPTV